MISGISLVHASKMTESKKMIRLWIHEIFRVFCDRLTDQKDQKMFFNIVKNECNTTLGHSLDNVLKDLLANDKKAELKHIDKLVFINFMDPDAGPKLYDEVLDFKELEVSLML